MYSIIITKYAQNYINADIVIPTVFIDMFWDRNMVLIIWSVMVWACLGQDTIGPSCEYTPSLTIELAKAYVNHANKAL